MSGSTVGADFICMYGHENFFCKIIMRLTLLPILPLLFAILDQVFDF